MAGIAALLTLGIDFTPQTHDLFPMQTTSPKLAAFDVDRPPPPCARWKETMPIQRDRDAYSLYISARELWRSKIEYQLTKQEVTRILNDVTLAATNGDWGARSLLAHFYLHGLGRQSNRVLEPAPDKSVEIVRTAVEAGQAWGYYDMGMAYEHGSGGIPYDEQMAWAYYYKAASLGSPDAQMALASAYAKVSRWDSVDLMLTCAYQQEHGPAAYELGMTAGLRKDFKAAIAFYHEGTKFGHQLSAVSLRMFFDAGQWTNRSKEDQELLRKLEIKPDIDRYKRYDEIAEALTLNPDIRLKRLDLILPLPPADLPAWPGHAMAIEPRASTPLTY